MPTPVIMPQLGESVFEGTVEQWLIAEGQPVAEDQPLLTVTTDKVDTDLPAPASGILLKIYVPAGQTVSRGTVLALIGAASEAIPEQPPTGPELADEGQPARTRGFISPAVARLAAELDVDLGQVSGTGQGGRITRKDVQAFARRREAQGLQTTPSTGPAVEADVESRPLSTVRRAIAEHMVSSARTTPHVTTVMEVDMTRVVQARERLRGDFKRQGVRLTFLPFFIRAVVAGLKAVPEANSSFRDGALLMHRRYHIGMATAVPGGLIVPVIRDADAKSLLELAQAIADLAGRAREGRLVPDEVRGGTFTITNHGTAGSLLATAIINQPQVGILGIGAIQKRAVVIPHGHPLLPDADDTIAIRPMVYLSFTFDHRVLDGASADRFLAIVKGSLEQ